MGSDEDLRERVEALERQVAFLTRHLGLAGAPVAPGQPPADVLELKRAGRVIDAIKRYRELTGLGLREAKDYVDRLR